MFYKFLKKVLINRYEKSHRLSMFYFQYLEGMARNGDLEVIEVMTKIAMESKAIDIPSSKMRILKEEGLLAMLSDREPSDTDKAIWGGALKSSGLN